MMDEASRKNALATEQALRDMDASIREQQKRIDGLIDSIGGLSARLSAMEAALMQLRIAAMGHGASTT